MERERERERETERDRETERERGRDREREKERERVIQQTKNAVALMHAFRQVNHGPCTLTHVLKTC